MAATYDSSTYDSSTYDSLGKVGLPEPVSQLAARPWDAVVVGGGHNGLTAAAYLAIAGKSVLVLEAKERLGGACTLDTPFTDERFLISPCAYLVGLLHPRVIEELDLERFGYRTFRVDPSQWTPFEDGTSLFQWDDPKRSAAAVRAIAPQEVDGFMAYEDLFVRIRDRLRSGPRGDVWLGDSPDQAALEELFADDREAAEVIFGASIADVVEAHVRDERLQAALHGQGVIGTFAGPRDPGTAWVHAHHSLGLIGGWGFVEGGMGRVSFCLADAAQEAGAVIAAGVTVAEILPGEGVRLESGEIIIASAVISNADPVKTEKLLGAASSPSFSAQVASWSITSPVIKLNCALDRLPTFTAAPNDSTIFNAQVEIARSIDLTQAACDTAREGGVQPEWCELYFQTPYDPSIAPPGKHVMSIFAQYVPYTLAEGTWDSRREEIGDQVIATIARFAPDVADCVTARQVLGPPDVEEQVGLTGGHIFQGEILPEQMWEKRFTPRTGNAGVYLCGAATHPGGSVMGVNGRNAAMAVLADSK